MFRLAFGIVGHFWLGACWSNPMKLLGTDTSPYVRKVRLVLLEKISPTLIWLIRRANRAAWWCAPTRSGALPR